jgi:hypothetical protein
MMNPRTLILAVAVALAAPLLAAASAPALAQSQGTGDGDNLHALIKEMKALLNKGEKERLIDPWFLRDLRKAVGRYENPWRKRLLSDDFSGRGPQPDPPWKVTAGEFLIDWRHGLRSVVEKQPAPKQQAAQTQEKSSDKDQVKQLFGQILQQTLSGEEKQKAEPEPEPQAAGPGFAAVVAAAKITNAFALRLEMTARPIQDGGDNRFEFGPFQGAGGSAGYRLAYMAGAPPGAPSLELISLSSRGTTSIIEVYDKPLKLEDGKAHVIEWTRDTGGAMAVRIDGAQVMSVSDRRFRDHFDGLAVINSGGDYALRSITIDGTE